MRYGDTPTWFLRRVVIVIENKYFLPFEHGSVMKSGDIFPDRATSSDYATDSSVEVIKGDMRWFATVLDLNTFNAFVDNYSLSEVEADKILDH